jgi:hypothetical protein
MLNDDHDTPLDADDPAMIAAREAFAHVLLSAAIRSGARLSGDEIAYFQDCLPRDEVIARLDRVTTPIPSRVARSLGGHRVRSTPIEG